MQYSQIIQAIDAYLERLQQVRSLLLSLTVASKDLRRTSNLLPAKEAVAVLAASAVMEEAVEPVIFSEAEPAAPVARRMRSSMPKARISRFRATVPPVAAALAATVSASPVYIPAEQVRQEHARRQTLQAPEEKEGSQDTAALTVESLTKRWLSDMHYPA